MHVQIFTQKILFYQFVLRIPCLPFMSLSHLFTVALVEPVYLPLDIGDILVTAVLIHLQDYAELVEGPNHVYCQAQYSN